VRFGCNITGFTDYYHLSDNFTSPNDTFLFMYHCQEKEGDSWLLRTAVITTYDDSYNDDDLDAEAGLSPRQKLYDVRTFPNASISVPYQIIDVDKINLYNPKTPEIINMELAVTCLIPGSETNLLKFFWLKINITENSTQPYLNNG
jgi:hypothetical protein